MSGPWERYESTESGPWENYAPVHSGAETAKDVANQGARGVAKGFGDVVRDAALLPLKTLGVLKGAPGAEVFEEFAKRETPFSERPEAETTAGRYAGRVGEALGATIPFTGGIAGSVRALPKMGPHLPSATERFLRPMAERPGLFLGMDAASATGSGLAAQAGEEAGLPPLAQMGLGLAGGVISPLGVAGAARGFDALGTGGAVPLPGRRNPAEPRSVIHAADQRALRMLADAATEGGHTADDLAAWEARAARDRTFGTGSHAPDERFLADFSEPLARTGSAATRQHKEAANIAHPAITARQTGITPAEGLHPQANIATRSAFDRENLHVGGQHNRMRETTRRALQIEDMTHHKHGMSAEDTIESLVRQGREESAPLYGALYKEAAMVDLRKSLQPIVDELKQAAAAAPHTEAAHINRMLREFAPKGQAVAHIERFDKAKQMADIELGKYFERGEKANAYLGRVMVDIKNKLVDAVDAALIKAGHATKRDGEEISKYKNARLTFAGPAEARREILQGMDIYAGKADPREYHNLSSREAKNRVKHGYFSAWEHDASEKKFQIDRASMFSNPRQEKALANIIDRTETEGGKKARQKNKQTGEMDLKEYADRPERFGRVMQDEQAKIRTRDLVKGGSPTATRLADDAAFDTLHTIAEVFTGGPGGAAMRRGAELMLNKMFGMRASTSEALARRLFSADEALRADTIAQMRMLMGRSKFDRFTELLGEMGRNQSPAGTVGGALSSLGPEAAE